MTYLPIALLCYTSLLTTLGLTSPVGDNVLLQGNLIKGDIIGCETVGCSKHPQPACVGSIKLQSGEAVRVISSTEAGVVNDKFGKVETISVDGNCCWRVAARKNMKGLTRDFTESVMDNYYQEKVKSVKKIPCEIETNMDTTVDDKINTEKIVIVATVVQEDTSINMTMNTTNDRENTTMGTILGVETTVSEEETSINMTMNTTNDRENTTMGTILGVETTVSEEETTINTITSGEETYMNTTTNVDQTNKDITIIGGNNTNGTVGGEETTMNSGDETTKNTI